MRRRGTLSGRCYPFVTLLLILAILFTSVPARLLADDVEPSLPATGPLPEAPGEPAPAMPPVVATGEASDVTAGGATLNGLLTDLGSADASWSTSSGARTRCMATLPRGVSWSMPGLSPCLWATCGRSLPITTGR